MACDSTVEAVAGSITASGVFVGSADAVSTGSGVAVSSDAGVWVGVTVAVVVGGMVIVGVGEVVGVGASVMNRATTTVGVGGAEFELVNGKLPGPQARRIRTKRKRGRSCFIFQSANNITNYLQSQLWQPHHPAAAVSD